jgi:hypothetical protein
MTAKTTNKGRRGYTKSGYPIVWKRFAKKKVSTEGKTDEEIEAEVHAICMARLTGQEVHQTTQKAISAVKKKTGRGKKKTKLDFVITADSHCLHLKFNGKTTYHAGLEDLAESFYKQLVVKKVKNRGFVKDLSVLKEIAIASRKEVLEAVKTNEKS